MADLDNFTFLQGGRELLPRVKTLWEQLNLHHLEHSNFFKAHFSNFEFEKRHQPLMDEKGTEILIDLVIDQRQKREVAYCLSSLAGDGTGEIESLYVEAAYCQLNLGQMLMERAVSWLQGQNASPLLIAVAEGNENVLPFYRRFGFYPRKLLLQYVPPEQRPSNENPDVD